MASVSTARETGTRSGSLAEEFERIADEHPDLCAVQAGGLRITYERLDREANRLAHKLIAAGVGPGEIVGVLAERGIRTVLGVLAAVKSGGAYLPLDPDSPPLRHAELLQRARCKLVLAPADLGEQLKGFAGETIHLDEQLTVIGDESPDRPKRETSAKDLFAILFTSGSTGAPRAIALEHRNMLNLLESAPDLAPLPGEGALQVCPAQFDVAAYEIWATLLNGGRLVCHPPGRPEPAEVCRTVTDGEVRWMALATSAFHQLAEYGPEPFADARIVLVGGEPLLPRYARRFRRVCPRSKLVNIYGPAETTVFVCAHEVTVEDESDEPIPIGRAIPGAILTIRDANGQPARTGEIGELFIGGPGVSRGYLHAAARDDGGYLVQRDGGQAEHPSGDLVREREDGALQIVGRVDGQVKISGYRVSPLEVEQKLTAHPGVRAAAVIGRADQSTRRLVAFVVRADEALDAEALRAHVAARAPSYMVPHEIRFLERLPMGSTGKLDRLQLASAATSEDTDPAGAEARASEAALARAAGSAAQESVRGSVMSAFGEVLALADISPTDDFLTLGGDSLTAVQLLARLRERLGVEIPVSTVFEQRTPQAIAAALRASPVPSRSPMPALVSRARGAQAPASAGQAKALLIGELAEESLPYQSQASHRILGELDVAALEQALSDLVIRHEILRTSFVRRDGTWMQVVHEPRPVRLALLDLAGAKDPEQALAEHYAELSGERIDPATLPLARWSLARLAPDHHAFLAIEHHAVHDGVSTALFLRELAVAYTARRAGSEPKLASLEVQYGDFAVWQQRLTDSDHGKRTLSYWRKRLAMPPHLELPLDRPRPQRQTYRGQTLRMTVRDELADAVRTRAREWSATPFMVTLAAYCALLARHGSTNELIVGSGLANRRTLASEQLIGMVVNTVALRIDLSGSPTPRELVERVRHTLLEAQGHQDVPFERVVEHVAPARRADAAPLYQTLFSFHDASVGTIELPGAVLIPRDAIANGSAKADLSVIAVNRRAHRPAGVDPRLYERLAEDGLTLVWEYNSDLFEHSTIERLAEQYTRLLEQMVQGADRAVSSLSLEPAAEVQRRSTGASSNYERGATIAEVFAARACESPNAVALSFEGRSLTYRELDRHANRLANRLRSLGIGRGRRVGVCLERSTEMIVALLAVAKCGSAYVPLDPDDPATRLADQLDALDAEVLLSLARHRDQLPDRAATQIFLDDELDLGRESDEAPPSGAGSRDAAYVMFTSGSTGRPNAVETTHRAVLSLVRDVDYAQLGPQETLLGLAPAAFDASTFEIWGALLNGGRLVLAPPGQLTSGELADLVRREGVTTMWLTAGLLRRVVEDRPDTFAGVRQLLSGGDVLSPTHVRLALQALPAESVLINGYGPTETTTFACVHAMRPGEQVPEPIPIGRPISSMRAYILDHHGQPTPVGVAGELFIGGDGVAIGYVGDPDLTSRRFELDPFSAHPEARMYRSGDLARWRTDGTIEFLGRLDRQLKLRGFRIEPAEIEARLRAHRDIADAVVQAVEGAGGERVLAAYVVPRPGAGELTDADLRAHTAQALPSRAVPSSWTWLPRLPLTRNGKVDFAALPVAIQRARPQERHAKGRRASTDPLERRLIEIWKRTLDLDELDPDMDFFELGGHSLLAVELFASIERTLGFRLPLATIFEAPTVGQLARSLREEGWKSSRGSLVALNARGSRPPLFFVSAGDGNSVGFGALARRLGSDQPFYALQPRGISGGAPLHGSVETMARHYVREVRRVRPQGPYLLGGRCLGAVVSYEMARLLEARGEHVALLVALDSGGPLWQTRPLADGTPFDETMSAALRRAEPGHELAAVFTPEGTERLLGLLAEPVLLGNGEIPISRYLHEVYLKRADVRDAYPNIEGEDAIWFVGWAWTSGRQQMQLNERFLPRAANPEWEAPLAVPGRRERLDALRARIAWRAAEATDLITGERREGAAMRRSERVRELALRAWHTHRAGSYGGVVTLIRSEEFRIQPGLERWRFLDSGGVVEREVRGTHRSMLREPDVESLASCVRSLVDASVGPDSAD